MILDDVVHAIVNSLKKDNRVQSIFLKGSIGRGEQDEHSDIDLYCLVNDEDEKEFLQSRIQHLEAYNKILFHDDIVIVAPQILAVYENLVHVDLFTVTEHTYIEKDYLRVLFELHHVMTHLSRVLLHRYKPRRAQLGMKTVETSLPEEIVNEIKVVYENLTPQKHP
ncbi:nucleotidyltransferase domain-containing protein [Psychrobacillus sp. NPDC096426]|uniref:nucleotidyltransferase domain-containing protein n=1 Tax=Psychrobacillus sp. NPDC096426 TaxID=3364491 RepID=UPI0037F701E8